MNSKKVYIGSSHKMSMKKMALTIATLVASSLSSIVVAQPSDIEEVLVFGRNRDLVGVAESASEGSFSGADLLIRPLVKTAELLESMPGMVAVQHSGSGKANQYFLRGFNLDHGTDYTVFVDGMPLNLRSHGHGQGYLDVNGLIPETVERIDYRKGPYRADVGDFSMAGISLINTIDRVEDNYVSVEAGSEGWQRYVGGASTEIGDGVLSLIGEFKQYDGPWEQPEDLDHFSIWSKYLVNTGFGTASFTVSGYEATWDPTEQIPERAIGSSVCADAFCVLDPTAEGETSRWVFNTELSGDDWDASLYLQTYDWQMSSNPTYDFQINQFDKRWTVGGAFQKSLIENSDFTLVGGADFRYDDGSKIGVEEFNSGVFVADISSSAIEESSYGTFLEGTWKVSDALRMIGGLRADYYNFDVRALNAGSYEGEKNDSLVSPKIGIAYQVSPMLELYGNWGKGFHSNDARGVVNNLDPVPGLSKGTGYEGGARLALGQFKFTGAYWWLNQDSELIFVGDSNAVEPKGGSERNGLEVTMFWLPTDWFAVDATYTTSEARYTDNPEGDYVEQAVEEAAQIGFSITRDNWDASLRMRYLGPYALIADNSKKADSLTTVNFRIARHWDSLTAFAEVLNLTDSDGKEIVYDYPAYIVGLDPVGLDSETLDCDITNCRMSRATAPRALRFGVSYKF